MEQMNLQEMTLEEMLEKINFSSLEVVGCGSGWVGTRYVLKTHSYGKSWPCQNMEELKQWIIEKLGWQLRI